MLPLATAQGAGAVSRRIPGNAVLGGMPTASLIAIFIVPVSFYVVEQLRGGSHETEPGAPAPEVEPPAAAGAHGG